MLEYLAKNSWKSQIFSVLKVFHMEIGKPLAMISWGILSEFDLAVSNNPCQSSVDPETFSSKSVDARCKFLLPKLLEKLPGLSELTALGDIFNVSSTRFLLFLQHYYNLLSRSPFVFGGSNWNRYS